MVLPGNAMFGTELAKREREVLPGHRVLRDVGY